MKYEAKALLHDIREVVDNHPYNPDIRSAMVELVDKLQLNKGKVEFDAHVYFDGDNGSFYRTKQAGIGSKINMDEELKYAFGGIDGIYGGTKVRVTIEKLVT